MRDEPEEIGARPCRALFNNTSIISLGEKLSEKLGVELKEPVFTIRFEKI